MPFYRFRFWLHTGDFGLDNDRRNSARRMHTNSDGRQTFYLFSFRLQYCVHLPT